MYEEMTPERIKAGIFSGLQSDLNRQEGSFTDDMVGPLALELYKMYAALNAIQPMVWVDETSGRYLDLAAQDLGLDERKAGTKAQATLQITGTAGFTVPQGTRFATADGLYFATRAAVLLSETGATVTADAEQVGARFNVAAETIRFQFQNDSRIKSVNNPVAAQGGTDPETDAALYARLTDARRKPATSGNKYDYERWALEVDGVGFAKCTPVQYGPGTVGLLVVNEERQPVDGAVVAACAAHIEEVRPIGAAVTVQSAEALAIAVTASVMVDGITLAAARTAFAAAFDAYLKTLAFREYTVLYNRVGALLISLDGVVDYSDLTLNGAEQNVTIGAEQVPVAGEVVFV